MTDYGRTIDHGSGGGECPPASVYTLTIAGVTDPIEKPGFNKDSDGNPLDIDIQSRLSVTLSGYNYDPDDEEDYDWNGTTHSLFQVWARFPVGEPDKVRDIYKSDRSNAGKFLMAVYGLTKEDLKKHSLDLDDLEGRKFQALVAPKENGYPQFSNPIPAKRPRKAQPSPVQQPIQAEIVDDDDPDADLFEAVG